MNGKHIDKLRLLGVICIACHERGKIVVNVDHCKE